MNKKTENTPLFERLASINVNGKTEKRNGFTYLSWAYAWSEFKKACPDATYEIIKDPETNKPYMVDEMGIMVTTRVTANGETHEMWLPVMDGRNNAQKLVPYTIKTKRGDVQVDPANMFDVNKTIMRCLVKNLAMFGLGIYIYAGEDLPDGYTAPKPPIESKRFKLALKSIEDGTFDEDRLREKFGLTPEQETELDEFMTVLEVKVEEHAEEKPAPDKKKTTKKTTTKK